jgi:hypothetical protein
MANNNLAVTVHRPLFLDTKSGFPAGLPNGAIVNIGGVAGPGFTVNGKDLVFADGTTTGGGTLKLISLQKSYNNSSNANEPAIINLVPGRDFIIDAPGVPGISFKIDATTGAVSIGNDLFVGGTLTYVNTTTTKSDTLHLTAQSVDHPALWIGPDANGRAPTSDLLVISLVPGDPTAAVLKVDKDGTTTASTLNVLGDLTVNGKINGVDLAALAAKVQTHIFVSDSYKHLAREINIDPGSFTNLPVAMARNVQSVLEFLGNSINNINAQVQGLHQDVDNLQTQIDDISTGGTPGSGVSTPSGYTFTAAEPMREWVIEHNKNSKNLVFHVFDENGFMFHPDSAQLVDDNTVTLKFGSPQSGRVNMMFYKIN